MQVEPDIVHATHLGKANEGIAACVYSKKFENHT